MSLVGLLFTTASGIFTYCGSLAITIRAVFYSHPIDHGFGYFIFAGLVPTVTFGSVYHQCLLDIHIQRLSPQKG